MKQHVQDIVVALFLLIAIISDYSDYRPRGLITLLVVVLVIFTTLRFYNVLQTWNTFEGVKIGVLLILIILILAN